ncbi:glutathione S-transferase family protein [Marinobacterium aestuariivivens]|uniref:Glutathione S-transferase family protein n=1 Tax=Marinobacterium aestuariivivens TaxID=1698799 RepID=A0ABW2A1Z0_9GAMM
MMILYSAPRSPYARKVRMALLELDLGERVEIRSVNPFDNQPDHLATNPLARVPALQLPDGTRLCDSRLILDYLDETFAAATDPGHRDWAQRNRIVLAEGVMDAACGLVSEERRPREVRHEAAAWRLEDVLSRALLALEASSQALSAELAGRLEITLCCTLGYMDFRLSAIAWRAICPTLADWFGSFSQRPSAQRTAPR